MHPVCQPLKKAGTPMPGTAFEMQRNVSVIFFFYFQ
jgi:hypothetical protein